MGERGYQQWITARSPSCHVRETEGFEHVILLATEESFYYMSVPFAPRRSSR